MHLLSLSLSSLFLFPNPIIVASHGPSVGPSVRPSGWPPPPSRPRQLVYGIKHSPHTNWAALERRCWRVLQALGTSPELLANLNTPGYLGTDGAKVTRKQRQLVCLARALVMNPEVLVVHKPTQLLGEEKRDRLMQALGEFTRNRGFLMDPDEPLIRRRKRTVIFTTDTLDEAMDYADVVFFMDGANGIRKVKDNNERPTPAE